MTDHTFGFSSDDVHALSGAYAVDALDDIERARFEEHLRSCPDCRAEVDSLREAAAALGTDAPAEPPAALRDQILAGIESVRPLPPLSPAVDTPDTVTSHRRRPRFGFSSPLLVAAALVLIAAAGTLWLRPWVDTEPAPLTATERVLAADDATRESREFPDGSRATIVVSRSEGRAVIITEDMAPAPDGKVYELWLQEPSGHLQPAGLMPDERDATVLLDGDASDAIGVGITVEPAGGSKQPTTEPIAFFALDA